MGFFDGGPYKNIEEQFGFKEEDRLDDKISNEENIEKIMAKQFANQGIILGRHQHAPFILEHLVKGMM